MSESADLHALVQQPFQLLREMERRSLVASSAADSVGVDPDEWVGVGFRLNDRKFVAERSEIREILLPAAVTRVPGARDWLLGLVNLRGQLLPIFDLQTFLHRDKGESGRTARILVLNSKVAAGLLVDEVFGFRRFRQNESVPFDSVDPAAAYVDGQFVHDEEVWPVFSFSRLVDSAAFQDVARQ